MREHQMIVRGVRLLVREQGEGPALMLGHGMWCEGGMFLPITDRLAPGYRIITPDLRGHGRSEVPQSPWTIGDLAEDYAAILDSLGIDGVILAGFSMGGMAALHFALLHPSRLRGLVLIGTAAGGEDTTRTIQINVLAATLGLVGPHRWIAVEAARRTFAAAFRRDHPDIVAEWSAVIEQMDRAALVRALDAIVGRPSLVDRLHEIGIPALVIAGSADRLLPVRLSRSMARQLPRARLEILRGAGHAVPIERPEEVAGLLQVFMKNL